MSDRAIRIYADTSVFGGVADREFAGPSIAFFERAREGRLGVVVSALVRDELTDAPAAVQAALATLLPIAELVEVSADAVALQRAYLRAGVVTPKWETDALHVAIATVTRCSAIVSWNFHHIVNFRRIPLYNGVNQAEGYGVLAIHSPLEVVADEQEAL